LNDNVINLADKRVESLQHEGPTTLLQLSEADIAAFIDALRARRLIVQQKLVAERTKTAAMSQLSIQIKIDKKAEMINKQMKKADEAIDKLEKLLNDMRALVLQHG
jgi:hypothetical protein